MGNVGSVRHSLSKERKNMRSIVRVSAFILIVCMVALLSPAKSAEAEGWGYINKTGRVVIAPQFDAAGDFSEGLARVVVD